MAATALACQKPVYDLFHRTHDYEVRDYAPYLLAETRSQAASTKPATPHAGAWLAACFFRDNRSPNPGHPDRDESLRINMTVTLHRSDAGVGRVSMPRCGATRS